MNYERLNAQYKGFIITGRYYNSRSKFRVEYQFAQNAMNINLWNGRVWGISRATGRRKLLKTVTN